MAVFGQLGLDMKILRVVETGEADDFLFREGMAAQGEFFVDDDILEPAGHAAVSGVRHSIRLASRMLMTGLSF